MSATIIMTMRVQQTDLIKQCVTDFFSQHSPIDSTDNGLTNPQKKKKIQTGKTVRGTY
jgi:hypothetical protein